MPKYEKLNKLVRIALLLALMTLFTAIAMPTSDLDIDVSFRKNIPREEIVQAIKKDKEYISKEKEKQKQIEEIKEKSYFYKLKETGILNENNTINYLNTFQASKLIKDGDMLSNFVKDLSTKDLINNFNQMSNEDKISSIIVIIGRNEFKSEYMGQLESANASILKEEKKIKKDIEEAEKPFNDEFNQTVKEKSQIVNKQFKYCFALEVLLIMLLIIVTAMLVIMLFDED